MKKTEYSVFFLKIKILGACETMKRKHKIKIFKRIYQLFISNFLQYVLIFFILIYLAAKFNSQEISFTDFLDIPLIISIFFAFAATKLSILVSNFAKKKIEEESKLTINYDSIVSKYSKCNNMVSYINTSKKNERKGKKKTSSKYKMIDGKEIYIFPIIHEGILNGFDLEISDKRDKYILPPQITDNYEKIMLAHNSSKVYNQQMIRLDKFKICREKKRITMHTSRTDYYNSLVTNRAMDYSWIGNITSRELYLPGPYVGTLEESVFSNHLGFNIFIETSDGKIIFTKRSKILSIGKDLIGASVSASVKVKYALDKKETFKKQGLEEAVKKEIYDELFIEKDRYCFSINRNLLTIYRDLIEGGKPHLFFYVKVELNSDVIEREFKRKHSQRKKSLSVDADKIIFIDRNCLKEMYITPDLIATSSRSYHTLPYTAACLVMLINYLENNN